MYNKNDKHVNAPCPECKSNDTLRDSHHNEVYCNHCGCILSDTSLIQITMVIRAEQAKVKFIRDLWKKK